MVESDETNKQAQSRPSSSNLLQNHRSKMRDRHSVDKQMKLEQGTATVQSEVHNKKLNKISDDINDLIGVQQDYQDPSEELVDQTLSSKDKDQNNNKDNDNSNFVNPDIRSYGNDT